MTCSYCGTHLPPGALFCGECGRSTGARPAAESTPQHAAETAQTIAPPAVAGEELVLPHHVPSVIPDNFLTDIPVDYDREPEPAEEPAPSPAPRVVLEKREPLAELIEQRAPEGSWCAQCGALLSESEIFCGECGFVRARGQEPRDTAILDPFPWGLDQEPVAEPEPEVLELPDDAELSSPGTPAPEPALPVTPPAPPSAPAIPGFHRPIDAHGHGPIGSDLGDDLEQTRIVAPGATGDRFILQFSTGESVSVTGSGLLGRNPLSEPGEYFDALVAISDPGKSVSKTHLEFGQDGGAFWISDRYSGNGTLFREPERTARRCEPGKRYRIARGTRVEIGEQFFIVS